MNEVAQLLSIDRATLYRIIQRGDLPAYRVGSRLRFRPEEVHAYVNGNREPA